MTLAELQPGQSATIESVDTQHPDVVRLMVLGLIEGAEVEYQNAAIGGDPLEVSVFGASISLRRRQAGCFRVTREGAGG